MKKVFCLFIIAIMTLSVFSACAVKRVDLGIRAAVVDNTTKVMKEDELSFASSPVLTASLAKNEYEGMQFVLSSIGGGFKVKSVTAGDLTLDGGTDVISASDISIYRQHYMYVDVHYYTYTGFADGWYPDALIEMKYDYSHYADGLPVEKNANQGYWLTVYAQSNKTAGLYKGEVTIETDKKTFTIPVECTVYDFELGQTAHFKTFYGMYGLYKQIEQKQLYYDFFQKYRLTPSFLPVNEDANIYVPGQMYSSEEDYYEAAKYAQPGSVSSYFLNLNGRRGWADEAKTDYRFYPEFTEMVKNLNKQTPGKIYAITADEPAWQLRDDDEPWYKEVKWFTDIVNRDLPDLNSMITFDAKLPVLGTEAGDIIRYTPDAWCIKPTNMVEGDAEDMHANGKELWWYTCNWPVYPAINTHIDSELVSSRILSWMEYDYDIDGYFCFSATTASRATDATHTDTNPWVNPYNFLAGADPNNPGNSDPAGDGYVAMIGKEGDGVIDENVPVPTIRLEALRDGMEDYEYLYTYENKINDIISKLGANVEASDVMQMFYDALYNDTADYSSDTNKFSFTRNDLASKICDDADFIYYITPGPTNNQNTGKRTIYVYTDGTQNVTINGKQVLGENGKYLLEVDIDETLYRNDFEITVGDKTVHVYCFPDRVNSSVNLIDFSAAAAEIDEATTKVQTSVVDGALKVDFTSKGTYFVIPYTCINETVDWKNATHLRLKISDGTADKTISSLLISVANGPSVLTLTVPSFTSGSVIDVPLTDEFKRVLTSEPTKFRISYQKKEDSSLYFSEMTAINKDSQDEALRKYLG